MKLLDCWILIFILFALYAELKGGNNDFYT